MISAENYKQRRQKVCQQLGNTPIVIAAFEAMQQTNDAAGPFIQDSNFFWLTGIKEPGWQLIIQPNKSTLVAHSKTEIQRIFDGGMSADEAKAISGVDVVVFGNEYNNVLAEIAKEHQEVYTIFKHPHSTYFDFVLNPASQKLKKRLKQHFTLVKDCRTEIAKLRAIKTADEIKAIKQAIAVSIDGFEDVRSKLHIMQYEYQVEAELSRSFRYVGSEGHAYQPIVAVGKNACTLHYIDNNHVLPKNGLILIDAGARVDGYAADITRTYAVGNPSEREKKVHFEVEKAQKAIIDLIKPGVSLKEYSHKVDKIMKHALHNLNLLKTQADYRKYFPHSISHGLGIDVHDSLGGYETFQPGMVLTVEPGIYITEEGIGVRIEDDILVTDDGNENLSAALATSL